MAGLADIAKEAGLNPVVDPNTGKKIWTNEVLERFFELILERVASGERVHIKNFGSFSMKLYRGRTLNSPLMEDGEVTFGDRQTLRFSQSQKAKAKLNELAPPDGKTKKSKKDKKDKGASPKKGKGKSTKKSKPSKEAETEVETEDGGEE